MRSRPFRSSLPVLLVAFSLLPTFGCRSDTDRSHPPAATQPASQPATTAPVATITIKVTDLRNKKGQLVFGVYTSAAGFPSDEKKSVAWQIKSADADSLTFTAALPPGLYGASVLHDENKNDKIDTNFVGIPKEGYGVTNNPKPKFRAAKFDESTFTLPPEGKELTISLQYF